MDHTADVVSEGLGIAPIYLGEQSANVNQQGLSRNPSRANGQRDGRDAAALATAALIPQGAVVYLDVEKADQVEQALLDYFDAWCETLVAAGYRPGLYTPFQMAKRFADRWHGLALWVVNGTHRFTPWRVEPNAALQAIDPLGRVRVEVHLLRPPIASSRRYRRANANDPDNANTRAEFPLIWQHTLDSPAAPPVMAGNLPQGWDYDGSVMRDPAFPQGEPRLFGLPGGGALALGSMPPARTAAGEPTSPRFGELWTELAAPPTAANIPADAAAASEELLHPWARGDAAEDPDGGVAIAVQLADGRPGIIAHAPPAVRRWTRARVLQASANAVRPLSGVRIARRGDMLHWFAIGLDGERERRVLTARRPTGAAWEPIEEMGPPAFRVSRLSALAVTERGGDQVDAFVLGEDGRLHDLWWARWEPWPPVEGTQIGGTGTAIHPQTPIAAVATKDEIDVFAIAADGRLVTTHWDTQAGWSTLAPIAGTARPQVLGGLAAAIRGNRDSVDVFFVGADGRLTTAWNFQGAGWQAGNVRTIGGDQTAPLVITDVVAHSPAADRIDVTVVAHDGQPMRTTWTQQADWTPLAAVNLPAFVLP
jgi:hypothetical protein